MLGIKTISDVNLASFDLNLLVGFDALMMERSVTRAARRVGLTQSAMSNMLRRLRSLLDDDVLVRVGHEMVPTARAIQLEAPIRCALREIQGAMAPPPAFDAATSNQVFWVGLRDYMEGMFLSGLAASLGKRAPNVEVRVRRIESLDPIPQLQRGDFGLAVGYFPDLHEHLRSEHFLDDEYVVIARKRHPEVRAGAITLDRYVNSSHVLISPMGGSVGLVDQVLAAQGRTRHVALGVATFLAALPVVARTDLLCTLPRGIAEALASELRLQIMSPPIELPPTTVTLVWHERVHDDPGYRWLRQELANLVAVQPQD